MLLSSAAEAMFWSGRYIERAEALSRSIQAVERLSLDLPGKHENGLVPLLSLVGSGDSDAAAKDIGQAGVLRALALDADNSSSVLGALRAARENLRHARACAPPELWLALNNQYLLLSGALEQPLPRVLDALGLALEAGSRIKGVFESNMARDAAYSFLNIGVELERGDMLLRVLPALLPATTVSGELPAAITGTLAALAAVHVALVTSYFPELSAGSLPEAEHDPAAAEPLLDPFEYLQREHAETETVLRVLDQLAQHSEQCRSVEKDEIHAIVSYLTECGELGHHEKEEAILAPKLIEHGFDWNDGPLATMRREHRHEHMYLSVLGQLARLRSPWSLEDGRRFATDARALSHFLRSHMDHERRDLFDQAARALPAQTKETLAQAFIDFDARQQKDLAPARDRIGALIRKYHD